MKKPMNTRTSSTDLPECHIRRGRTDVAAVSKSVGGVRFSGNPVASAVLAIHDAMTRSSVQLHDLKAGANDGSKTAREPRLRCGIQDWEGRKRMPWRSARMKPECEYKSSFPEKGESGGLT